MKINVNVFSTGFPNTRLHETFAITCQKNQFSDILLLYVRKYWIPAKTNDKRFLSLHMESMLANIRQPANSQRTVALNITSIIIPHNFIVPQYTFQLIEAWVRQATIYFSVRWPGFGTWHSASTRNGDSASAPHDQIAWSPPGQCLHVSGYFSLSHSTCGTRDMKRYMGRMIPNSDQGKFQ